MGSATVTEEKTIAELALERAAATRSRDVQQRIYPRRLFEVEAEAIEWGNLVAKTKKHLGISHQAIVSAYTRMFISHYITGPTYE